MQSIPVQSWTFEQESVIRIGRSTDNHVILYSAVVSRHHVEIRQAESGWEIVNLGANGTYLDGKRITAVPVEDGVIIRLARSGPNVQIHLGPKGADAAKAIGEKTVGQRARSGIQMPQVPQTRAPESNFPEEAEAVVGMEVGSSAIASGQEGQQQAVPSSPSTAEVSQRERSTEMQLDSDEDDVWLESEAPAEAQATVDSIELSACCQQYLQSRQLFCLECGKPLHPIGRVGDYQLVKVLRQDEISLNQLGWKDGQTFELKTLVPAWLEQPEVVAQFEQEARQLLAIDHPALPQFVDLVLANGQPYLVMQPLYGKSLYQLVWDRGPLPVASAIAVTLQICEALHHLHTHQPPIVHQKIRPEHILLHGSATPLQIIVSGLLPGRSLGLVQSTTAAYGAPEQQQGEATIATDLYAIGPTLVYLLTGKTPDNFYAQRENGFRFYPEYAPGLEGELITIVRKLTNPQPSDRYTTASEVSDHLKAFLATQQTL